MVLNCFWTLTVWKSQYDSCINPSSGLRVTVLSLCQSAQLGLIYTHSFGAFCPETFLTLFFGVGGDGDSFIGVSLLAGVVQIIIQQRLWLAGRCMLGALLLIRWPQWEDPSSNRLWSVPTTGGTVNVSIWGKDLTELPLWTWRLAYLCIPFVYGGKTSTALTGWYSNKGVWEHLPFGDYTPAFFLT